MPVLWGVVRYSQVVYIEEKYEKVDEGEALRLR